MTNSEKYQEGWEQVYSTSGNPFDIDEPYRWVMELEENGKIRGTVLDAGCGAGHNSIYLAARGFAVTGVDISSKAIERARQKARDREVVVNFVQANACELAGLISRLDTVIDIGCFHSLYEEDYGRYTASLHRVCRAESVIHLRAFSDANKSRAGYTGPAVAEEQIRDAFSVGWTIRSLERKGVEVVLFHDKRQTADAWFAEIDFSAT